MNNEDHEVPHPDLIATGWFLQFWGPSGQWPVQLIGVLTSGEYVYFRARGSRITLEVAASQEDWSASRYLARFFKRFETSDEYPYGASTLEPEKCVELIKGWLTEYLGGARPVSTEQ